MIEKYRITANLMEFDEDKKALHMGVKIEGMGNPAVLQYFNSEIFEAVLKAMKNANKRAFYEAMATFADKDLDDATEWIREQMKDGKNTIL